MYLFYLERILSQEINETGIRSLDCTFRRYFETSESFGIASEKRIIHFRYGPMSTEHDFVCLSRFFAFRLSRIVYVVL